MKFSARAQETVTVLRKWLADSNLAPGARLPPERQIALQLQATHYAVNRAANRLTDEGLLRREGYKLYYTPEHAKPSNSILILTRKGTELYRAAQRIVPGAQINLQIVSWLSHEDFTLTLSRSCASQPLGLLYVLPFSPDLSLQKAALDRLRETGIPCIHLGQQIAGCSSIDRDLAAMVELAVQHLNEIGHTELGLLTFVERNPSVIEVLESWDRSCRRRGLLPSARRLHFCGLTSLREVARKAARKVVEEWPKVTGLVVHNRDLAPFLVEELAHRHRRIPAHISVICVGDTEKLKTATPPIDCAGTDGVFFLEMAIRMLHLTVEKKAALGKLPRPQHVVIKPELILRESTAPRERRFTKPQLKVEPPSPKHSLVGRWPDDPIQIRRQVEEMARRPYTLTNGLADDSFDSVDLAAHVNRPVNIRRGWLGDGSLQNLNGGDHHIHGVPFKILGGSSFPGGGAVVLRSLKNTRGFGRELPERIRIEVGCKARAIYLLHGCNYAEFLKEIAVYDFYSRSGLVGSVPLISLAECPNEFTAEEWQASIPKANIQDWWPDYFQTDFEHARRVIVVQEPETMQGHRYLYTLEWVNPRPQEPIAYVEVRGNPQCATTLGILAVSVLRA